MTRQDEIAEFRSWSKKMTIKLMEKFAVDEDPENISYDEDDNDLPLLSPLVGEDLYRGEKNKPTVVSFDMNARLWKRSGGYLARGFYAFALFPDRTVKIGKHGHDQIAKGGDVNFAGEVLFSKGTLLFWTNRSGHYKPHPMLATAMPFPIHRYSSHLERSPWVVGEALKATNNTGRIARWLGWQISEVEAAYRALKIVRYQRQW